MGKGTVEIFVLDAAIIKSNNKCFSSNGGFLIISIVHKKIELLWCDVMKKDDGS